MPAFHFCGIIDSHLTAARYSRDSNECVDRLHGAGISGRRLKRYARLVVQHCTPNETMSTHLLESFPGWPLQLDAQTASWVRACTETWQSVRPTGLEPPPAALPAPAALTTHDAPTATIN